MAKENKTEFPEVFLRFWEDANEEVRMKAAYVGYLRVKECVTALFEALRGISHD